MNKYLKFVILLFLIVVADRTVAQDIQITKFERNYTSLIASMNPVIDNTGETCAVIRFFVRDMDFDIEPNLGVMKRDTLVGEVRLWVPKGTKRITVRHQGVLPLSGYSIPIQIEPKATYEAVIELSEQKNKNNVFHLCFGAGYNIVAISGPSISVGLTMNQHSIEAGIIKGLKKSDDLFFYGNDNLFMEAHCYQALRIQVRYGYVLKLTDFLNLIPQVGGAFNVFNSRIVNGVNNVSSKFGKAHSFSAFGALRLSTPLSEHIGIQVTP